MGIMNWLGIGKDLSEPIKSIGDLYTTDKARIDAQTRYTEVAQKPTLSQLSNNSIMASSPSLFNSGWQPLLGWTSGFLVFIYYAPQIIIATFIWGNHCFITGNVTPFPIKPTDIMNLVYLLFGFGAHSIFNNR